MRWGSEALLREKSVRAGVCGHRVGSKIKLTSLGDGIVLIEGLVNLHERRSLLGDTAVSKNANFKTKKLTKLLNVRCNNDFYTIREQTGVRAGGWGRRGDQPKS